MKLLNIDKLQIPIQMLIIIEGEQYEMQFDYNAAFDFFTVSLSKDGVEIVIGEKMVLNRPLFTTINRPFDYTYFIPMDLSGEEERISYENWGSSVYLWVYKYVDGVIINE